MIPLLAWIWELNTLPSSQSMHEKENVNNSHNDIEKDSNKVISDVKHLEIDKSTKDMKWPRMSLRNY